MEKIHLKVKILNLEEFEEASKEITDKVKELKNAIERFNNVKLEVKTEYELR